MDDEETHVEGPDPTVLTPQRHAALTTEGLELPARFEVIRVLGQGGMGTVLEVRDHVLGREVALKLLPESLRNDPITRARFVREARAAAVLKHPNVVMVHDVDVEHGFIVMEIVRGESLSDLITKKGALPLEEVLRVAQALLNALVALHREGIVHRDVKPGNVLIEASGSVKLVDFGIAFSGDTSLTSPGSYVGTPSYAAPEQLRGRIVDARADIYAAGVTLFHAATGTKLHSPDGTLEDPERVLFERTGDRNLTAVLIRAISERPEQRFPSAQAFLDALLDPGSLEPTKLPLDSVLRIPAAQAAVRAAGTVTAEARRSRLHLFIAPLMALAIAALGTVWYLRQPPPRIAPQRDVRVALLPFHASSGYLSGGLAHLLGEELRRVPGISVIGYYKLLSHVGREDAPAEAWIATAERLEADVVIVGELTDDRGNIRMEITVAQPGGRALARLERTLPEKELMNGVRSAAPELAGAALGKDVTFEPGSSSSFELDRHVLLGVAALEQHRLNDAFRELQAAEELDRNAPEVQYYLALVTWWHSQPAEMTMNHIDRALAGGLDPARVLFLQGLALLVQANYPKTIAHYNAALKRFPEDRDILYGQFEALYHGGYPSEAMVIYRKIYSLYPNFRLGMIHLTAYYLAHADDEGIDWMLSQRFVTEEASQSGWIGRIKMARRDYQGAEELIGAMMDESKDRETLTDILIELYAITGRVDLAIATHARRMDSSVWSIGGVATMMALHHVHGTAEEENAWRERGYAALTTQAPGWPLLDALISLALIDLPLGDRPRLLRLLSALDRGPLNDREQDVRAHLLRVFLAAELGRAELIAAAKKSEFPEVAAIAEAFGAEAAGDFSRAEASWRKAYEHSSDGRFAILEQFHLARAAKSAGDRATLNSACSEVIQPRLMTWAWAPTVGPCNAWTKASTSP